MNNQAQNNYIPDYAQTAVLTPESWRRYFDKASAYMDAAFTLMQADLFEDARRLLDLACEANEVCRENFASADGGAE
jgi:hypothetical protein